MLIWVYIAVLLLNILNVFLKKQNNFIILLSIGFIFLLMQGNYDNADYIYYEWLFNHQNYSDSYEKGYVLLSSMFYNHGLMYNDFLTFIFSAMIIIGILITKNFKINYHYIIIGFLSYPVFFYTIQIRAFIAEILFIGYAICISKRKKIISLLFLGVMALFHITSIVYILFWILWFSNKKSTNKIIKLLCVLEIVFCLFVFVNGNRIPGMDYILKNFIDNEKNTYFTTQAHLGFLYTFLCQLLNFSLAYVSDKCISNGYTDSDTYSKFVRDFSKVVYYLVLFSCFSLPLLMINSNFVRFVRINNMLLYIQYALAIHALLYSKHNALENQINIRSIPISSRYTIDISIYKLLFIANLLYWSIFKIGSNVFYMIMDNNSYIK